MIDLNTFRRDFLRDLLAVGAELEGIPAWEAERRYHTDPRFHAQVDAIVDVATAVIRKMEHPRGEGRMEELSGLFHEEAVTTWDESGR